ncbi:hypothetical protein VTL71DRAFT_758 [Oculimacula yallundae]|uniref:Actin-like ATPase domain-containing protein n=1 Tax=Oculimacula yallundae TaxID=86028 RepID=A0ABR4D152_9HELO
MDKLPMKILIAVDFGTTFTGVAYVNTRAHHNLKPITNWEGAVQTGEKVPTVLKYDGRDYRWGFQVQPEEEGKCEWFKLSLYDKIEENDLTRRYPIVLPDVDKPDSEKMVIDYLTSIREHVEQYLSDTLRTAWTTTPREWIITVPAVWPDKSKAKTLEFTKKAGMEPSGRTQIVAEPEAAGIYALENMRNVDLTDGDTFVVCDAGGGYVKFFICPLPLFANVSMFHRTVDLVSYTVTSLSTPAVREAAPGSGGLCGGSFLNRIFSDYLDNKFALYTPWTSQAQYKLNAMATFENRTKRIFTGKETKPLLIPVTGLSNNVERGIRQGQLAIPVEDMKMIIFEPVMKEIIKLVKAQIRATVGKQVKSILLAGGFGANKYLCSRLQAAVRTMNGNIKVWYIEHGNTAIVLGALYRGLSKVAEEAKDDSLPYMRLDSRIARQYYGVLKYIEFDPQNSDHEINRREEDPRTGGYRLSIIDWFIKKGDTIRDSKPKKLEYSVYKAVEYGSLEPYDIEIMVYKSQDGSKPPLYMIEGKKLFSKVHDNFVYAVIDPRLKVLVKLRAHLDKIPRADLGTVLGKNEKTYYSADYDIDMALHSASISFTLVHAGDPYAAVEAEFM